jgi:hypothetical protein
MTTAAVTKLTTVEAIQIATDAYVFGYPLVLMDVTRQVMTGVETADEGGKAPMNQFAHHRRFPDDTFKDVVSPNADTLYSVAWLDLGAEPMVLSVPEMGDRYYLMPMLDAWTNVFASPGTRTTGGGKHDFAIVGPSWRGTLQAGLERIAAPTNLVWVIGRTQTNGKDDYAAVHALQNRYRLAPLSRFGRAPAELRAPVNTKVDVLTPPAEQVRRMSVAEFFSRLSRLMKQNPPSPADADAIRRMGAIGLAAGRTFDLHATETDVAIGIEKGAKAGYQRIATEATYLPGKRVNGWTVPANAGSYGNRYLFRAAVAMTGLGANLPDDAVYPMTRTDGAGKLLDGSHRYIIRFSKDQMPPVRAFWSLTMYGEDSAFVKNPIGRYAIGDRDRLTVDRNGNLTITIQATSPGPDKESNWLPAPPGSFHLAFRMYWPQRSVIDGAWKMPPIERVD